MSVVHGKFGEFPVTFDELVTEGHLFMRKATFEKLVAGELQTKLTEALGANEKLQHDLEWVHGEKAALEAKLAAPPA